MKQFLRNIAKGTSLIILSILISTSFGFLNGMKLVDQDRGIKWINTEEYLENTIQQWQKKHCLDNADAQTRKTFAEEQRKVFFDHSNIQNFLNENPLNLANKPETVERDCVQIIINLHDKQTILLKKNLTENYRPVFSYQDNSYTDRTDFNDDSLQFLKEQGKSDFPLDIIPYNYLDFKTEEAKQNAITLANLQFNHIFNKLEDDNLLHALAYEKIHFLWMLTSYAQEVIKIKSSSNEATFLPAIILKFVNALWVGLSAIDHSSPKYTSIAGSIAKTSHQIAVNNADLIKSIIGDDFYENINTIKDFITSTHENIEDEDELYFKIMMMFCCLKINNFVLKEPDINVQVSKFQEEEQPGFFSRAKNWLLGAGALVMVGSLAYLFIKTNQKPITNIIYVNDTPIPQPQNTTTAMTQWGSKILNAPETMCEQDLGLICNNTQGFDGNATLPRNLNKFTNGTYTVVCNNQGQCIDEKNIAIVNVEGNSTNVADFLTHENQNIITPNLKNFCNLTKHADKCPELHQQYQEFLKSVHESRELDKMHCKGKFKGKPNKIIEESNVNTPEKNTKALQEFQEGLVQNIKANMINQIDQNIEKLNHLTIPGNISALNITTVQNLLKTLHTTKNNTQKDFHLDQNYVNTTQNNLGKISDVIDKLQETINSKIQVGYFAYEKNKIKWQNGKSVETIEYPIIYYSINKNDKISYFKLITQNNNTVINAKNANPSAYFTIKPVEAPKDVYSFNDGIIFHENSELTQMYIKIAEEKLVNIINANKVFEN